VEHGDSMGNTGIISSGDTQWMTAGNGIVHQEMPKGDSEGRMLGFQLWANLPKSHKMMEPRYRDVKSELIPVVKSAEGVEIRIICGKIGADEGPVQDIIIDPEYLDITIPAGAGLTHSTKRGHTVFAYVIDGNGRFSEEGSTSSSENRRTSSLGNGTLALFDEGDQVKITTEESGVRLLLISGKPIKEPIAWSGPIVMNTEDELRTAFEEYRNGTFIKDADS
jgi:redox-sensitive bicupin YhaK (pirin superfamily)